jgi:protein ImuA
MSRFPVMTSPNALLPASGLAHLSSRAPRWRPGLAGAHHSEVFASAREASGAAAALALAADALAAAGAENQGEAKPEAKDRRALLWVQDRAALRLGGRPYRPGLPRAFRDRLIHVACDKPEDVLFALEEGLRCHEIAAVIGEIAGNPRALDFTASRRLTLTAEKHGVPLWLVRLDAAHDLSSARMRWDIAAAPSPPPRWNREAPGAPSWRAELFRARMHPPGTWTLRDDPHGLAAAPFAAAQPPHPVGLAFADGDRPLAT